MFCRVKEDVGVIQVDDSVNATQGDDASTQDFQKGDVHALKYRVVRSLVADGRVELI